MSKKETKEKVTNEVSSAAEETSAPKKPRSFKKLKFGSMSAITVAVVLAIVILANVMAGMLEKRAPLKLDITPDKRYELSEDTVNVLKNLDKDVEITVTASKETFTAMADQFKAMYLQYYGMNADLPYDMIPGILDKYAMYAENSKGSINVKYIDINHDPETINKYKQYYTGDIAENNIVICSGERVRVLSYEDIADMIKSPQTSSTTSLQMSFAGESVLTSAIMSVTDSHPVKVAVAKKYGGNAIYEQNYEIVVSALTSFLTKSGYDCIDIDIATDTLSAANYDMLLLPVPNVDLSVDVISKLSDFLYNDGQYGKNLLYIPNYGAFSLPNIDEFLADWCLQVESSYIIDEKNSKQTVVSSLGQVFDVPVVSINEPDLVGQIGNDAIKTVAPFARPVTVLSKNNTNVVKEILKSSDSSFLYDYSKIDEKNKDDSAAYDRNNTNSYNVAVLSTREQQSGMDVIKSNVLVVGSSFMFDDAILSYTTTYSNAEVILGMLNNISGKSAGIIIADKTLESTVISPTMAEANVIKIIVIIVIPALVAIAGAIVLIRRKNK